MMKMFRSLLCLCVILVGLGFLQGCSWQNSGQKKIPAEDRLVLEMYSDEIAILKSRSYETNSKEKYYAAKAIADGVDFSYIRNVQTLDDIFGGYDVKYGQRTLGDEQDFIFYYQYGDHDVRFVFHRVNSVIISHSIKMK